MAIILWNIEVVKRVLWLERERNYQEVGSSIQYSHKSLIFEMIAEQGLFNSFVDIFYDTCTWMICKMTFVWSQVRMPSWEISFLPKQLMLLPLEIILYQNDKTFQLIRKLAYL